MRTIYKYPLEITLENRIEMPMGAEILHMADQGGKLFLWALVDTSRNLHIRIFNVIGTGHPIEERRISKSTHIGTAISGIFVWHVFEV